ncbi:MAG: DUF4412 domain-containing protein [Bacteroidota bacterium]
MKSVILYGILTIAFTLSMFCQGLYWESNGHVTMMGNEKTINTKFYAMPKMFKSVEGDDHESIIRLDKNLLYDINHKDSTYKEMTFEEMDTLMKKGNARMEKSMSELQDKLKDMPEEQRKMVEQMMSKRAAMGDSKEKYDVKNTGETETISGFSCSKYIISQGDKEVLTLWATKDVKGVDSLKADLGEFRDRMARMMPRIGSAMAEGMKGVDGFPIQVESSNYKSTVTKVEQRSTPESSFLPPKDYKKLKNESMDEKDKK